MVKSKKTTGRKQNEMKNMQSAPHVFHEEEAHALTAEGDICQSDDR